MKKNRFRLMSGMGACLLFVGWAWAQSPNMLPSNSPALSQGQKAPSPAQWSAYAPSDIAAGAGATDDRRSRRRQGSPLTAAAAAGKGSAASALNIPHLCFQPGIGWTAVPANAFASHRDTQDQPSDTDKPGSDHSPQAGRGLSAHAEECPPTATS